MSELTSLTAPQRRVLGVLIEKSLTTPQYYPLTLNALVTGCNQKSNRDPVVEYTEVEVDEFLSELQKLTLITVVYPAGGRSEKYRHELTQLLNLDGQELAVLGELLLRGAQSIGDLRSRASRMKKIASLDDLEAVLNRLREREYPLVIRLSPEGMRRGVRYCHNLYSEEELSRLREREASDAVAETPARPRPRSNEALDAIRERLDRIEKELGLPPLE